MRLLLLAASAVLLLPMPLALAAPEKSVAPAPAFTSIDACALNGGGVAIGDGGTCLRVTGGVSFTQSWGNAAGGYLDAPGGQPIVTTPSGTYTIPAPR